MSHSLFDMNHMMKQLMNNLREMFHQSDEVMNKMAQSTLNNCLVLQRNFEACVTAAKSNQG